MRAGYIRVSTEEQEKGLSPEAQTNRLIAAGVAPDAITVETGSASKVKVPQLLALLERAKAGEVTEIVTLRQDRLQRSHEIDFLMWQLIKKQRCTITFLDQGGAVDPDDPVSCASTEFMGVVSRLETAMLSQRVKNALAVNRDKLKHHGPAPFGYINKKGKLQPDPKTWDIARKVIVEYVRTGSSTAARRIRYQLQPENQRKPWSVSSFARWIKSPVIRGAICYDLRSANPEIHWKQHEPLMQPAEWDAICAIRKENLVNGGARRGGKKPHLGTGIFKCAHCGGPMHVKAVTGRQTTILCTKVLDGGCPVAYRNHILEPVARRMIDTAIFCASQTIAERSTPSRLPEPAELTSMRQELSQLEAMKSPRAKAAADSLRDDVLKMQAALYLDEEQRQEAIYAEWHKISNSEDRTDADRKRIATNYGLTIKIEHGKMVGFSFKRLRVESSDIIGSLFQATDQVADKAEQLLQDARAGKFAD